MSQEPLYTYGQSPIFAIPPQLTLDVLKYRQLLKIARVTAVALIVWGGINMALGLSWGGLNHILALLGCVLIGFGIYGAIVPGRMAYTLNSISLAILAVWNLSLLALGLAATPVAAAVLGILQVFLAYRVFARGGKIQSLSMQLKTTPADMVQQVNAELDSVNRGGAQRPDVVELTIEKFQGRVESRGVLGLDRMLVLAIVRDNFVTINKRDVAPLLLNVPLRKRGNIKVKLPFDGKMTTFILQAGDMARVQEWARTPSPASDQPPVL